MIYERWANECRTVLTAAMINRRNRDIWAHRFQNSRVSLQADQHALSLVRSSTFRKIVCHFPKDQQGGGGGGTRCIPGWGGAARPLIP